MSFLLFPDALCTLHCFLSSSYTLYSELICYAYLTYVVLAFRVSWFGITLLIWSLLLNMKPTRIKQIGAIGLNNFSLSWDWWTSQTANFHMSFHMTFLSSERGQNVGIVRSIMLLTLISSSMELIWFLRDSSEVTLLYLHCSRRFSSVSFSVAKPDVSKTNFDSSAAASISLKHQKSLKY